MSTSTTTIVSNADVDFYFTGVNSAFRRALKGNNRAIYPSIAYVPPAGVQKMERFGAELPDGTVGNGTRVKFPISLAASRPRRWPFGQPRQVEPFSFIEVSVDMARWAPPAKREFYDVFNSDLFGLIKDQLPDMMDRAMILWDEVLAEAFATNAIWAPDGLPFFSPASAPHPANPFKLALNQVFTNDYPVTGIDVPQMRFLLSQLTKVPGPDGKPLDTDQVEIVALCPDDDFGFQMKQVFQAAIAAQPVGANAAAGVSNMLMGAARVQVFKQLGATDAVPTFGGTAQDRSKVGYFLAVPKGGEGRPCAVVPNRHPTAFYTGLNGSDHLRASQGAVEYGWDAYGEALLTVAQRALRFVINPV